jgi:hypothetical protein
MRSGTENSGVYPFVRIYGVISEEALATEDRLVLLEGRESEFDQ